MLTLMDVQEHGGAERIQVPYRKTRRSKLRNGFINLKPFHWDQGVDQTQPPLPPIKETTEGKLHWNVCFQRHDASDVSNETFRRTSSIRTPNNNADVELCRTLTNMADAIATRERKQMEKEDLVNNNKTMTQDKGTERGEQNNQLDHSEANSTGTLKDEENPVAMETFYRSLSDVLMKRVLRPIRRNQHIVLLMKIFLGENDSRFGFSIMGGRDEGFPPRVDDVTKAHFSPQNGRRLVADQPGIMDLQGYVILVVNTLEGSTKLYGSPAEDTDLQIGDEIVEVNGHTLEDASHSEVIAHIHQCIKTRTIQLRVRRSLSGELIGREGRDIQNAYVVAVEETARKRLEDLTAQHKVQALDISLLQGNKEEPNGTEAENDLDQEPVKDQEGSEAPAPEEPATEVPSPKGPSGSPSVSSLPGEENMDSAMVNGYVNGRSNGLIHEHAGHKMTAINSNQYMINHRSDDHLSYDSDSDLDRRPHREMAIDVPDNFVGHKKERPSYPPTLSKSSSPRKQQVPPPAQDATDDEMQRIRRYQEDLRKRREEEDRHIKEEEFLRASLRGSKKLQALEEMAQQPGFVNPTYVEDMESRPNGPYPKKLLAVEDLFASLQNLQKQLRSAEDQKDVAQISKLFTNTRFQQALRIHNKMVEVNLQRHKLSPVADNSQELCGDVMNSLNAAHGHPMAEELRQILQTPNFKMLMYTHDHVATNRARLTASAPNDDDEQEYLYERVSQYNADSIKIVRLHKTAEPLGATVRNNGESVIVGRIVKGGAAEKSGLLHEGDEILEINGIDIRGKSVNDVCDIMANMTGTLTFLIVPEKNYIADTLSSDREDKVLHLRALFDYDPEDDIYIPCRELGISFEKRDILHVISQEDANWWQAYREGEDDQALAGLIPSKSFQEQREAMRQTLVNDSKNNKGKKKPFCNTCRGGGNKKKKQLYGTANDEAEAEEILTYEEVSLYYPQPNRKRPIVLIGPPGVGRQELRSRLMTTDEERYGVAVPHTSRPPRDTEKDGIDYHFVSRHVLEQDIANQKFVEFGEYEKNLYGTSLNSIRAVVQAGKTCILNLHPQSLRILKNSDLKPYIVFIAAPNIDKLRTNRLKQGTKFTENELKDIIEQSRELEEVYGHYFDYIIVNFDLEKAYDELLQELNRLEVEPQWVPAHWVL